MVAVPLDPSARLLVTGASGQLGKLVVTHLLDTLKVPADRIVAASRSTNKLEEFAKRGVTTRQLDFTDAASVEAAAQGVDRALLISGNDVFNRVSGHKTAITALVKAGVKHILYTSLQHADKAEVGVVSSGHVETEKFLREAKVPRGVTILRNGLYFDNSIGNVIGAKHNGGKWFSSSQSGKTAGISRSDLALANAAALASNQYPEWQVLELAGAKGLTIDEIVADISKAIELPIEVVQVPVEVLAQGISQAAGVPIEAARVFAAFSTNTAAGHADVPASNDFKKVVGRDAQSHADWVQENAALLKAVQ